MKTLIAASLAGFALIAAPAAAQDDNGIPGDCPYTDGAYYQPGVFPRYEFNNRRIVLVSWTTGEDVREIDTSLDAGGFHVLGWSADCRYLAVGLGAPDSIDTVIYDTITPQRMGTIPDAHGIPHTVTWGPGNYAVVETRGGAVLWHVPAGTQITLTDSYNTTTARNFSRLRWDAENSQLIANLAVGGRVVYDRPRDEPLVVPR